jgi:Zn-dependent protease
VLLFGNYTLAGFAAALLAALMAMTIHEFAHCYVADLMGDDTPRRLGRLTLNPFAHIHLIGFLMFVIIGFGTLGSAPISPYRMRNPRWGMLAAVAAGPLSNLLLAIVFAIPFRYLLQSGTLFTIGNTTVVEGIFTLFRTIIMFNILLFLFNFLPLSPLDGWTVALSLLPPDLAYWWQKHQQTSQFILFGLILLSYARLSGIPSPLGLLIAQPAFAIYGFLTG